jgi:hypothetical protein
MLGAATLVAIGFFSVACSGSGGASTAGSDASVNAYGGSPIVGAWGTTTTTEDWTEEDYWAFATDGKATNSTRRRFKSGTELRRCFEGTYAFADATLTITSLTDGSVARYEVVFLDDKVRLKRALDATTSNVVILSRVASVPAELRLSCAR